MGGSVRSMTLPVCTHTRGCTWKLCQDLALCPGKASARSWSGGPLACATLAAPAGAAVATVTMAVDTVW